jgi:hypothetical protein
MGLKGPNLGPIMGEAQVWAFMGQWRPKLRPIMGGAQVWTLMGPWGDQTWAHHGRGSSLGHDGPKLAPSMSGPHVWALMSPWGAQTWAHHGRGSSFGPRGPMGGPNLGPSWAGLKFGPSWAHGVPKLGPIMGGAQVWAPMGPWKAQTWAHHGRGSSLGPHEPMGGPGCGALAGKPWHHYRFIIGPTCIRGEKNARPIELILK